MITESTIYWATRLDYIRGFSIAFTATVGFIFLLLFVMGLVWKFDSLSTEEDIKNGESMIRSSMVLGIVFLISCLTFIFVPSTKEYCAIKIIPVVAENTKVQELPNKALELANEWLDTLRPAKPNPQK